MRRPLGAQNQTQHGRFTAAGLTADGNELTAENRQIEVVEHLLRRMAVRLVFNPDISSSISCIHRLTQPRGTTDAACD